MHENVFLNRRGGMSDASSCRSCCSYAIRVRWFFVMLGGEPSKAILVNKDPKRIAWCDGHVNAKIKFETIDDERLKSIRHSTDRRKAHTYSINVDLNNEIVTSEKRRRNDSTTSMLDYLTVWCLESDSWWWIFLCLDSQHRAWKYRFGVFSLRSISRSRCSYEIERQVHRYTRTAMGCVLGRKAPGFWIECVFFGKDLHHPWHVSSQRIFAAYFAHTRKVIDFLWTRT